MYLKQIDHALNLALLESDDASFFDEMKGLEWGNPEKGQAELPDQEVQPVLFQDFPIPILSFHQKMKHRLIQEGPGSGHGRFV